MSYLGVHFALTDSEVAQLKSIFDEQDRIEYITEEILEQNISA